MILMIGLSRLSTPLAQVRFVSEWMIRDSLLQQDILRLQIAMYQLGLTQQAQPVQQLLRKHAHQSRTEPSELILLDQTRTN